MLAGNNKHRPGRARRHADGPAHARRQARRVRRDLFFGSNATPTTRSASKSPPSRSNRSPTPTGAGDSFAGGFFGYLASQSELTPGAFRRAMFYGSVMGSFTVERFGTDRLQALTREEIDHRFNLSAS